MIRTQRRQRERGTAILITMLLTVALLAGGAVLLGMQLSGTRSVDVAKTRTLALHCAEAGIAAARTTVAAQYANWTSTSALCNPPAPLGTGVCVIGSVAAEPSFLTALSRDLDNPPDGNADFRITLLDNDDGDGNMAVDNDQQVFLVSTCVKYGDIQQQVRELIKVNPGVKCSESQKGGCNNIGQ